MSSLYKILICTMAFLVTMVVHGEDCVDCGVTTVAEASENESPLVKLEELATAKKPSQGDYVSKYCLRFQQINRNQLVLTIREMEKNLQDIENTPNPIDDYFQKSECRMASYSGEARGPMLHHIADDPGGKQDFLEVIHAYYEKRRQDTNIFTKILNAKNTKGETLLDYIETLKSRELITAEHLKEPVEKIINFTCKHGGKYSQYKKQCPT